MSKLTRIALLQHACTSDVLQNLETAMSMMRQAARQGAQVVFTQELFTSQYFCQVQDPAHFDLAVPIPGPLTHQLCSLAKELNIHLVASVFEKRAPGIFHNTSLCINATGTLINRYRKMHIPQDPGFNEKFYLTPGTPAPGSFSGSQVSFGQSPMLSPFPGAKHGISPWNQEGALENQNGCLKTSGAKNTESYLENQNGCLKTSGAKNTESYLENQDDCLKTSGGKNTESHLENQSDCLKTSGGGGYQVTPLGDLKVGTLICWDQWFPEAARLTAMLGAQILTYPTAIGYWKPETAEEGKRQRDAWITIQRSHAIANGCYVAAINRIGREDNITFWGSSFIVDPGGQIILQATEDQQQVLIADIDLSLLDSTRQMWPFFRDRRVDSYGGLLKRWGD